MTGITFLRERGIMLTPQEWEDWMVSVQRNRRMGIAEILFVISCILGMADGIPAGDDNTKESAWLVDKSAQR